jgi:hypothetical protein
VAWFGESAADSDINQAMMIEIDAALSIGIDDLNRHISEVRQHDRRLPR